MGLSTEELKSYFMPKALETAQKAGIRLEWYSPTCYKQFNPLEFGFGAKACSAAQYNMTIEPDGSVIPCQSWFKEKDREYSDRPLAANLESSGQYWAQRKDLFKRSKGV